jgi:hypothetical protein
MSHLPTNLDIADPRHIELINPSTDALLSLKSVCRLIPGRRGKGIALTTVYRWAQRGCKGCRLDTILIGGTRYTTRGALDRFVASINQRDLGRLSVIGAERHDEVETALDSEGL